MFKNSKSLITNIIRRKLSTYSHRYSILIVIMSIIRMFFRKSVDMHRIQITLHTTCSLCVKKIIGIYNNSLLIICRIYTHVHTLYYYY